MSANSPLLVFIEDNSPQVRYSWQQLKSRFRCLIYRSINEYILSDVKKKLGTRRWE